MLHLMALRVFGALPRWAKSRAIRLLYPTYTAGVVVAVTNPVGQVLLVTHSYSPGWGLPGGLMNRNEDPATTAQRELVEELGLEIELTGLGIAVQTPGRYHFNFLFKGEIDTASARAVESHSPEITGAEFYDPGQLPELSEFTDRFLETLGLTG
jgi:8-oxo-dGTP diphosphatase